MNTQSTLTPVGDVHIGPQDHGLRRCLSFQWLALASMALFSSASLCRADLVNRWSFNAAAQSAVANGTVFNDTVQGAALTVRSGTNDATTRQAALTGTAITLPGTTTGNQSINAISAYLDLPNGIVSSRPNFTVEAWITPLSSQTWQRLFDFGRTNITSGPGAATGEITTPTSAPGSFSGFDYLSLSLNNNTTFGSHRLESRLGGGTQQRTDLSLASTTTAGTEYHFVMTVADRVGSFGLQGCRVRWYRNGVLQRTLDLPWRLPQISDVNNWIGRSNWSGDRMTHMSINELRLYNHALSAAEVTASFTAGADPTYTTPVAVNDARTLHHGGKVRIPVLANDTGSTSNATLTLLTPPAFGTAVVQADGRVLYTHTTGSPSTDSFTYRVGGPAGLSNTATVTLSFASTLKIASPDLNVPAQPPATAVQFVNAFPGLTFASPICLRSPPGDTQRLFVVERGTGLRVIPNVTAVSPTSTIVFQMSNLLAGRTPAETLRTDSENGFLSIAFHPNYATNGHVFLFYSVEYNATLYQRISRVTLANPTSAAPSLVAGSEIVLIDQHHEASNHNGGDMHFGPDGYLYIALGDEGGQNDQFNNGQRINRDFFAGILRIDVDKRPGNLEPNPHPNPADYPSNPPPDAVRRTAGVANYSIPVDNPFVHTSLGGSWNGSYNGTTLASLAHVRSEFFATGMRNPWRMSFDPPTGDLWVGDVGGGLREEVILVTRGGNYGWAFREGGVAGPKNGQAPANFTTLFHSPPLYEYAHGNGPMLGDSITGGVVYRGTRFPSLTGAYIFCDYVDGNVWSLTRSPSLNVQRLFGETNIVAFGHDPANGDVLACNLSSGSIRRLVVDTAENDTFPTTLSATGVFSDLTDLAPAPGLLPYQVNQPFWSDHGIKSRWLVIPDGTSRMTWSRDGVWSFPTGQVWVKHFDMEMTRGLPSSRRRIETRLLVKTSTGGYGVSYQWNDAGTEAFLVPDSGADFNLNLTVAGNPVTQPWRIPSRAECMSCHNNAAGVALSSNTRQLNLAGNLLGHSGNQLELLATHAFFTNSIEPANNLQRHLRENETAFPVEARARSWLAVNCSYCHMPGTNVPGAFDLRAHLPLDQTGIINGAASNNGGNPLNRLIVPGSPLHSILYNRAGALNGFTRMPPLATAVVDQPALDLLEAWITGSLPARQSYADWRLANFGNTNSVEGAPNADADGDGATNQAEYLAGTDPWNGTTFLNPQVTHTGTQASLTFTLPANRSAIIEVSPDLITWTSWNIPGNHGLPTQGGPITLSGPVTSPRQFFRVRISAW